MQEEPGEKILPVLIGKNDGTSMPVSSWPISPKRPAPRC